MILNERGVPTPNSEIVRRLAQINPKLALVYQPAFGWWSVTKGWEENDPRWARVQSGELPPAAAVDVVGHLPGDCPVDEAPAYLTRSLRSAPLSGDEITALLSRVDHYNDENTKAQWADATAEGENRIEVRSKWRFDFGDRSTNLHLKKV